MHLCCSLSASSFQKHSTEALSLGPSEVDGRILIFERLETNFSFCFYEATVGADAEDFLQWHVLNEGRSFRAGACNGVAFVKH